MRRYLGLLFLLICTLQTFGQGSVEARLDSTKILIGGQATLSVKVRAPKQAAITFPTYVVGKEITQGVEILNIQADTTEQGNDLEIEKHYTLTAWEKKTYTIPSQNVKIGNINKSTQPVKLQVDAIPIDTTSRGALPPDNIKKLPLTFSDFLPAINTCIALILLLFAWFYVFKKIKQKGQPTQKKKERILSPSEEAIESLEALRAERIENENQKQFYSQITDILRRYISSRYAFQAKEMISDEIIENLSQSCPLEEVYRLKELFYTADLVKFAKHKTSENEKQLYLSNALDFAKNTKQDEVSAPIEAIDPANSEKKTHKVARIVLVILSVAIISLLGYLVYDVYQLLL